MGVLRMVVPGTGLSRVYLFVMGLLKVEIRDIEKLLMLLEVRVTILGGRERLVCMTVNFK